MSTDPLSCPACGRPKTRRATLCRTCRKRAVVIGVKALLDRGDGDRPAVRMISPGQRGALFGRAQEIDELLDLRYRATHDESLEAASAEFGRKIGSVNELSFEETSWVLDRLGEQLAALKEAIGE